MVEDSFSLSPPVVHQDEWGNLSDEQGNPISEFRSGPQRGNGNGQHVSPIPRIGCYHYNGYYFDGNGQPVDPNQYPIDWRFSDVVIPPRAGCGVCKPDAMKNMLVQTIPPLDLPYKSLITLNRRGEIAEIGKCGTLTERGPASKDASHGCELTLT